MTILQEQLLQELSSLSEMQLKQVASFINSIKTQSIRSESIPDDEQEAFYRLSIQNLNDAYGDDEPDYSLNLIQEHNPDYEGR
jgi:hypothetical protein